MPLKRNFVALITDDRNQWTAFGVRVEAESETIARKMAVVGERSRRLLEIQEAPALLSKPEQMEFLRGVKVGSLVWWEDPASGLCSQHVLVQDVPEGDLGGLVAKYLVTAGEGYSIRVRGAEIHRALPAARACGMYRAPEAPPIQAKAA